jgi:hypothetical protein
MLVKAGADANRKSAVGNIFSVLRMHATERVTWIASVVMLSSVARR